MIKKSSDAFDIKRTSTEEGCIMEPVLFAPYFSIIFKYAFTDQEIEIKSPDLFDVKKQKKKKKKTSTKEDCVIVPVLFALYFPIISPMSRVFANSTEDRSSIPGRHTKDSKKRYLMPPSWTLSIIKYGSTVKWSKTGLVWFGFFV